MAINNALSHFFRLVAIVATNVPNDNPHTIRFIDGIGFLPKDIPRMLKKPAMMKMIAIIDNDATSMILLPRDSGHGNNSRFFSDIRDFTERSFHFRCCFVEISGLRGRYGQQLSKKSHFPH
jgi:hypothetical protein